MQRGTQVSKPVRHLKRNSVLLTVASYLFSKYITEKDLEIEDIRKTAIRDFHEWLVQKSGYDFSLIYSKEIPLRVVRGWISGLFTDAEIEKISDQHNMSFQPFISAVYQLLDPFELLRVSPDVWTSLISRGMSSTRRVIAVKLRSSLIFAMPEEDSDQYGEEGLATELSAVATLTEEDIAGKILPEHILSMFWHQGGVWCQRLISAGGVDELYNSTDYEDESSREPSIASDYDGPPGLPFNRVRFVSR